MFIAELTTCSIFLTEGSGKASYNTKITLHKKIMYELLFFYFLPVHLNRVDLLKMSWYDACLKLATYVWQRNEMPNIGKHCRTPSGFQKLTPSSQSPDKIRGKVLNNN